MKIVVDAYLDNNLGDDLMIKLFADHFSEHNIYIFEDNSVVRETFKNKVDCKINPNAVRTKKISFL
ncbi:hypothetical protein ACA611_16015 [Lactiplantibacillus plantarum]|uniref:hypothetical protein n=1 Tax=Lactiplantibacillus plantarum TaxID=1590 RepID=UPI003C211354